MLIEESVESCIGSWASESLAYYRIVLMSTLQCTIVHIEEKKERDWFSDISEARGH